MLKGKRVLLTGATDGIGRQTAFRLAQKGAILLLHGKSLEKGKQLREELIQKTGNERIFYYNANLISLDEIRKMTDNIKEEHPSIDILLNNAGVYENKKNILENSFEKTFMVNHLAMFFMTLNLMDLLKKSGNGKIINVSSIGHAGSIDFDNLNGEKHYSGTEAYSLSKLCNLLFTYRLAENLSQDNISVNALHPGVINTKLLKAGWGPVGNHLDEGADRLMFLAENEDINGISGAYFENDKAVTSSAVSYDKNIQEKLWDLSLEYANA